MTLSSLGHLIAQQRRAKGFTLASLAAEAKVGRSTLAALETGKLSELGFTKIARLCAAVGLVLDARRPQLEAPLMQHRHLTPEAGRELTKAAIEDIIVRGNIAAWRGLIQAIRNSQHNDLAHRVQHIADALDPEDPKVHAFVTLLPQLLQTRRSGSARG